MNRIFLILMLGATMVCADEKVSITTTEGKTYEGKVTRVEASGIVIMHAGGIARIDFAQLPAETQEKYGYDPENAAAQRAAVAKAQQARQSAMTAERDAAAQKRKDAKVTVEPTAAATAPEAPPIQMEQKTAPVPLPTSVRKWTSEDGRTLLAKVTEIDLEKQTLKFVRADGKEFLDYPISNLIAEDRAYLTGEPAPLAESVGKDFGIGGEYDVAQQVNLRSAPSLSSGLIVNEKATRMLEGVHYLSIDSSTTVKVLELANEWARIQVTEPQFLSASHRGWVPVTSLVSGQHSEKLDGWIRNDCMVYETKGKVNAIGRLTSPSAVGAADDGSGWLRLIHGPVKEILGEGYVATEILDKGAYFERESLSTVPPGKW